MNVRQCRMARAALDWSQMDLAKAAGLSARTVIRYEAGEAVLPSRTLTLQQAFEKEGVLFIDQEPYVGGVIPPPDA